MNLCFHIPAPVNSSFSVTLSNRESLLAPFSFRMNFAERGFNAVAHRFRTADTPEVHKKQSRLLSEHVAMERRHQDIACLEFGEHRVYLVRGEHEVAGCGNVAGVRCLEIDGLPYS